MAGQLGTPGRQSIQHGNPLVPEAWGASFRHRCVLFGFISGRAAAAAAAAATWALLG